MPIHVQDARDYHGLSRALGAIEPQVVVHLAAIAHAGKSNKDPMSTFGHSLRTLENALDYARGNAEHFVYFSSSMVYGNFREPEVSEDHPLDPIGIYGALKLAGEKIVIAYKQVFDLDYTIIRPSALYGPGCVSRRVSQIVHRERAGRRHAARGRRRRRAARLLVHRRRRRRRGAASIGHPAARNEAFNITTGAARTLAELIAIVQEHFPEVDVEYVERDALRPYRGTLSIDKARRLIGYEPRTTLEEGLDRYVAWYRDLVSDGILAGSH